MPDAPPTGWLAPRPPSRLPDRAARRVARWCPMRVASIAVVFGLALHELVYHLTGGADFPFLVAFDGSRIFALSHGGLDALAVGILVISVLHLIHIARAHASAR